MTAWIDIEVLARRAPLAVLRHELVSAKDSSLNPIELSKAYRRVNHGPTVAGWHGRVAFRPSRRGWGVLRDR